VHAKKGARQHYQPIQSQLSLSHQPLDVVKALLSVYPFTQLYIADLNAIQKLNSTYTTNLAVIEAIQQHFPQLTLWLDAGITNHSELSFWQKHHVRVVLGSENFINLGELLSLSSIHKDYVLSLDFFSDGYRGPAELLTSSEYWPQDVIVMCLAKVGTDAGMNTSLLNQTLARAKGFNIYAAGGVRNIEDLKLLKSMGIKGALVATAIHKQKISSNDIKLFNQSN
jgi:phosphoribosylformimino-5-aminoimidazole carboxamide ribotide isomerase